MSLARHLHTPLHILRGSQTRSAYVLALQPHLHACSGARSFSRTTARRAAGEGEFPDTGDDRIRFDEDDFGIAPAPQGNTRGGGGGGSGPKPLSTRRGAFRGPTGLYYADEVYDTWKTGQGNIYRDTSANGRNYLGGDRPFPLNPSFMPPVPLSDEMRSRIYLDYMRDGLGVREISQKYHISLRRVEAVLRLKHLEIEWKQEGRPLETKFRDGMEEALGVTAEARSKKARKVDHNAELADFLGDLSGSSVVDGKSVKLYWEPVKEGDVPILEGMVSKKHQRQLALANAQKHDYPVKLVPRREGNTFYEFVDVGDLYVEPEVLADRAKRTQRRRAMRIKQEAVRADELRRAREGRSVDTASRMAA